MLYHLPLAKTHSGLRSVFSAEFVQTGTIPRRFFESLARGAHLREQATYTVYARYGRTIVSHAVKEAEEFFLMAQRMCRRRTRSRSR